MAVRPGLAFPSFIPGAGTSFIGGTIAASTPTNIIWAPADGNDPYYTLNGGANLESDYSSGRFQLDGFDCAYYLDTRTVTADRVLPNTFYLYYAGVRGIRNHEWRGTWTQDIADRSRSRSGYNSEIQSVPGEAGNLFFTVGPQSGLQPTSKAFINQPIREQHGQLFPMLLEVSCFGFGAAAPGQSYPSIYIVGCVNSVYGIWQSINDAQSWTQIGTYPTGSLDSIKTISGDPNIYGQVYVGFSGDGYAEFTAGPAVTGVTASPSNGVEVPGSTITLTLNMSEAVTVAGGTPTLTLNDGATATYDAAHSTSTSLAFDYTVAAGQNTPDLTATAVNLNSATVTDGAGNAANLSLSGLTQSGPQIDTTSAAINSIVDSPSSGDFNAGKVITLTLGMSENVTVNTTGGSPTLTLNDGGTATYVSGSGSSALVFSYTVASGQNTADLTVSAVNLNGATLQDGAGNAANLSLSGLTQGSPQIDTTTPAVSSVVASGAGIRAALAISTPARWSR